jgi:hypothetical protein
MSQTNFNIKKPASEPAPSTTMSQSQAASGDQQSSSWPHLSPTSATLEHARTVVFEQLALMEDSSTNKGSVLYGQAISCQFVRVPVPSSPSRPPVWDQALAHEQPDLVFVDMLHTWITKHFDAAQPRY